MMTVHTSGGLKMLQESLEAVKDTNINLEVQPNLQRSNDARVPVVRVRSAAVSLSESLTLISVPVLVVYICVKMHKTCHVLYISGSWGLIYKP